MSTANRPSTGVDREDRLSGRSLTSENPMRVCAPRRGRFGGRARASSWTSDRLQGRTADELARPLPTSVGREPDEGCRRTASVVLPERGPQWP
jgi:hypothetical protein